MTGEYIDGVESSRTRRIDIYIDRKEINNEWLAIFQDIDFWPTYIYDFLIYVTHNASQIIDQIKKQFTILRREGKFNIGRRNDQYAQLCISANLFLGYGLSRGAITNERAKELYQEIECWICQILEANEKETKAISPLSVIIKAFYDYAQEDAEPINYFCKDSDKIYQNEEYFFVAIPKLLVIAASYADDIGASNLFPSERELPKLLERENLILIKKEGEKIRRTLHLPGYTTGNRFLWVSKVKLEQWVSGVESEK